MPTFANTYGTIITVFVLFHSLTAYTKLSVVSPPTSSTNNTHASSNSTMLHNMTGHKLRSHRRTKLALEVGQSSRDRSHHRQGLFLHATTSNNTNSSSKQARRRSKYMTNPDSSASFQNYYSGENDYSYQDYQSSPIPDLTTVTYPLLTTLRQRHTEGHKHRKPVTKLYVKPVRRTVGFLGVEEEPDDDVYDGEIEKEIVPLASLYSGMYRLSTMPTIHISQLAYPGKAGTFAASSAGFSASGYGFSNERSTEHLYAPPAYHIPISHEGHSMGKLDLKKIGIIALLKIGLAKLKLFGVLKLLFFILLKFKLFLMLFFIKFLLFLKAIKHLKAMLLPFFLLLALLFLPLLLLPLLLPLLLLRYLLPLLLLLPTPLGRPANNMNMANAMGNSATGNQAGGNRIGHDFKTPHADPIMEVMMQLLDSEQCVERIACQLATKRESKLLFPIINWYFDKLRGVATNRRMTSYVDAFVDSTRRYQGDYSEIDGRQWCANRYSCVKTPLSYDNRKVDPDPSNHTTTG